MNTPQTAIGKGTVGEPAPAPPGKEGITVRVFIIFDGTKNNRTNSAKRLSDSTGHILKLKGVGSSYGNSFSNPAIDELMNTRQPIGLPGRSPSGNGLLPRCLLQLRPQPRRTWIPLAPPSWARPENQYTLAHCLFLLDHPEERTC